MFETRCTLCNAFSVIYAVPDSNSDMNKECALPHYAIGTRLKGHGDGNICTQPNRDEI